MNRLGLTTGATVPRAVLRARALVLRWGRSATAYQIINPGIGLWFGPGDEAVAGYVDWAGHRVVAGAPVCDSWRMPEVVAALERDARAAGRGVCFFGVEEWFRRIMGGAPDHSVVLLGAQPEWEPKSWGRIFDHHASLRAQLHRASNKGVVVEEWPARKAASHAGLRACLEQWLGARGLPPMHFLVEPETLECLFDRRLWVARRGADVAGFLVASPVPPRDGWLIEQIVRGRAAVNGTSELLLDQAVRTFAAEGSPYVTLGLAALSRHAALDYAVNPLWLRFVFGWVRVHGARFYNFEGLDWFKAKFEPEHWEPVYAIANQKRFSVAALRAVAGAFSAGSPEWLVARAGGRALLTEGRWLWQWFLGRSR